MFKALRAAFWEDPFSFIGMAVFVPVFLASWAYFIATYGFMLGVGLGWFPAAVIGGLAVVLSPFLLFLLVLAVGLGGIAAIVMILLNLKDIIAWVKHL